MTERENGNSSSRQAAEVNNVRFADEACRDSSDGVGLCKKNNNSNKSLLITRTTAEKRSKSFMNSDCYYNNQNRTTSFSKGLLNMRNNNNNNNNSKSDNVDDIDVNEFHKRLLAAQSNNVRGDEKDNDNRERIGILNRNGLFHLNENPKIIKKCEGSNCSSSSSTGSSNKKKKNNNYEEDLLSCNNSNTSYDDRFFGINCSNLEGKLIIIKNNELLKEEEDVVCSNNDNNSSSSEFASTEDYDLFRKVYYEMDHDDSNNSSSYNNNNNGQHQSREGCFHSNSPYDNDGNKMKNNNIDIDETKCSLTNLGSSISSFGSGILLNNKINKGTRKSIIKTNKLDNTKQQKSLTTCQERAWNKSRTILTNKKFIYENMNLSYKDIPTNNNPIDNLIGMKYQTSLQILSLAGNTLLGKIPKPFVKHLVTLRELNLSCCGLRELPHTWNLPKLTHLYLQHNLLLEFPNEYMLQGLPQLKELNLRGNSINQIILPSNKQLLANLLILDVSENDLLALPVDLPQLSSLRTLYATHNLLGSIGSYICQMSNLKTIDISSNPISTPPIDVCGRGVKAIRKYWQKEETKTSSNNKKTSSSKKKFTLLVWRNTTQTAISSSKFSSSTTDLIESSRY